MRRTPHATGWRLTTAAAIAAAALSAAAGASAATIHVETSGTDSAACGAAATPCETVARGVTNAVSGDTVDIGAGTFPVTNTIIVTAKNLSINGAGIDETFISGGSSTAYTNNGTFRFTGNGTKQSVRDLTFVKTGRSSSAGARAYGLVAQPQAPAGTVGTIDMAVTDVGFDGGAEAENPFTSNNNGGRVVLDGFTTSDVRGNSILLGRHTGPFTLRNSHLETSPSDAGYAVYAYTWGGPAWTATGKQLVEDTTIDAQSGIAFAGGFTGLRTASYTGGIEITGSEVRAAGPGRIGVSVTNAPEADPSATVPITDVEITGNSLFGAGPAEGAGDGVRITGLVSGPEVSGNTIRRWGRGILVDQVAAVPEPVRPSGVTITRNQLVDNATGPDRVGLQVGPGITDVTANDNWWGCNAGPRLAQTPVSDACDAIAGDVAGVEARRWVVLGLEAAASKLEHDESSDVTASLAKTNTGASVPGVFDPRAKFRLSATGGVLSDPSPPVTSDAVAEVAFRSTVRSGRSVSAQQDHQTVKVAWPDLAPELVITSPANDLVTAADSTVVEYAATPDDDGSAPDCTPANGATVPLPVGETTITVRCQYSSGATATATARVTRIPQTPIVDPTTPLPQPTPSPTTPDLPACARDLMISDVAVSGRRSRIEGRARRAFAGQQVSVRYQPSGSRVIARPRVRADGTFSTTVSRPSSPPKTSDRARYSARIGGTDTRWIKLTRRMGSTTVEHDPQTGRLSVSGTVAPPVARGARLQVTRSDVCGDYKTIGTLRVHSNGTFNGTVATAPSAAAPVAFIRLSLRVRSSNRRSASTFTTYSIVQPVPILPS